MTRTAVLPPAFTWFWSAQTISQVGQRFGMMAMPVIAINLLAATPSQVGYLTASLTLCYLLIGLPAGAWVDRWNKRRTMIVSAGARAVVFSMIPVLWLAGALELWWLYLVGILVGVASVFFDVAYQSMVPILVEREDIETANSRLEASAQVAAVGGPALAGALMGVISAPLLLAVDAVAYLCCGLFLGRVTDKEQARTTGWTTSVAHDVREGLHFVFSHAVLRRLVLVVAASNFFATIAMTLTPILVLRELGYATAVMGVILGVGSLGGIVGAAALPWFRRRLRPGVTMAVGLCLASVSTGFLPLAGMLGERSPVTLGVLIGGQFSMTFGAVLFNVTQVSTRQKACPPGLLARMTSSIRFVVWGSMPLAAAVSGWLAAGLGVVAAMWVGLVGALLAVLPILGIDRLIVAQET